MGLLSLHSTLLWCVSNAWMHCLFIGKHPCKSKWPSWPSCQVGQVGQLSSHCSPILGLFFCFSSFFLSVFLVFSVFLCRFFFFVFPLFFQSLSRSLSVCCFVFWISFPYFLLSLFLLRCRSSGVFIGDFPPPQPTSLITVWELVFCTDSSVRFGSYLPGIMILNEIGIDLCVLVGLGCRHFNFPSLLCRRTFNTRGRRRRTVHVETALFWSGNDHFQFDP